MVTVPSAGGAEMAFGPTKNKKKTKAMRQGRNNQAAGPSSADRATATSSDVKLDKARPSEKRPQSKRCPQEKQPEGRGKAPKGPGPYFYISGSNGAELLSIYCQSRGWQRIYDNRREDYALKWCEIKCPENYYHFKEGEQLLYQIPNNGVLTTKIGLLCCLREQERVMKKMSRSNKLLKMKEFFPESFRLDIREERKAFFELSKEGQIWICKPSGSNQGQGIFLLKTPAALHNFQARLHRREENPPNTVPHKAPRARIVQRYIQQPLLLEGKKFDVRSYLLIACTAPFLLFYAQGYLRLSCVNYDATSDDLTVHLTNQKRMQQIMVQCFLAAKHKLDCKLGYFDLIGCDFLIDENFKVWLLEMNANPALHTNCRVLKDIIPPVVYESLDLVLEVFNKRLKGQNVFPLETLSHFVLLYHEDAANPGQKEPWKLRSGLWTGRYLRPHEVNISHFSQSSAKVLKNSSKKLPCSRKKRLSSCSERTAVKKLS
ncbi:inactive polyglycylase TTLL10 isoform X3 [Heliangelus exortis]|uniref:inactive polyglycylase TTLL10 isoform X3 n=1 Tax=Heliangelus exortis TaxID=472823 RepID=UPI003A909FF4